MRCRVRDNPEFACGPMHSRHPPQALDAGELSAPSPDHYLLRGRYVLCGATCLLRIVPESADPRCYQLGADATLRNCFAGSYEENYVLNRVSL